jgi:hypothetical protein
MKAEEHNGLPVEVRRSQQAGKALQLELARLNAEATAEPLATPQVVDFTKTVDYVQHTTGRWNDPGIRPISPEGYVLNKQQIYRRMRRARKKFLEKMELSGAEQNALHKKPLADWDAEELARGRPRDAKGGFKGPKPAWVTAEMHEEAMDRFKSIVRTGMRVASIDAIEFMQRMINDEETDNRGRPLIPASTKLQAAQFLVEHLVGKPTQRVESDVSVKLQGLMAQVMVNPGEQATGNYMPAHFPGFTMELAAGMSDDGDYEEAEIVE